MEGVIYTLQDFMTHTKGITYILILCSLVAITGFWQFLAGNDDDE